MENKMKSIITIDFKRIAGKKVNAKLLEENPKLPDVTKQTLIKLCQKLKEYFQEYKIKVGVSYKLENE
jgi:hypothetical protein